MSGPNLQIEGGAFTDAVGNVLNEGYLILSLSHDESYSAGPNQVVSGLKLKIGLDSNGNIPSSPATLIYSSDVLTPSGSYFLVIGYKADGTMAFGPQAWVLTSGTNPLNVGTIVPLSPPGGASFVGPLTLETNSTQNSDQNLLNLTGTGGITVSNSAGTTTITGSGSGLLLKTNGTNNASQSALNLESTDSSITLTDLGSGNINLQASGPAGSPKYMAGCGYTQPPLINISGLHPGGGVALAVIVTRFGWLSSLEFNTIAFAKIGGTTNIHMIFGLYSGPTLASPGALLWSSGDIAVPNSAGAMEVTVPSYTITPSDWYLAMTTNVGDGGAQVLGINMDNVTTGNQNLFNQSVIGCGVAANAAAFGSTLSLPATLGNVSSNSGGASAGWPMVMFYKL